MWIEVFNEKISSRMHAKIDPGGGGSGHTAAQRPGLVDLALVPFALTLVSAKHPAKL